MMNICIDTNAYALFKTGDKKIIEILEKADEVLVPVIVLGELYAGFYQGKNTARNIKELSDFLNKPGISVIDIDIDIANRYGDLIRILKTKGTPLPINDVWIAAVVLETGSKLFSFDKHFKQIPGILNIAENI